MPVREIFTGVTSMAAASEGAGGGGNKDDAAERAGRESV